MSSLLDSLKDLKDKISQIEDVNVPSVEIQPVVDNKAIIAENLAKLKELQTKKVVINVGGKFYTFSSDALKETVTENIFQSEKSYFYDGSPDLFSYVADILRSLKKGVTAFSVTLRISEDEVVLKEMLKQIFPKYDELMAVLKIEREVIVERVVTTTTTENVNAGGNPNYGGNAAYNNGYNY